MKPYTAVILFATQAILPCTAMAECQMITATTDKYTPLNLTVADTQSRITETTIISRTCYVTTRLLYNNKWYTVAGKESTAELQYNSTDRQLCEAAVDQATRAFSASLTTDTLNTATTEYCSEGTLHVHPVKEGDITHYSESIPDPTRPGTFDYIAPSFSLPNYDNPPGNKCEFFVEVNPKNENEYLYYGVRCKIVHSDMWKVEIKRKYVSPNDEYELGVDDQIVPFDGIIAPLNYWQTYWIGGLTAPRGKRESIAKCDQINSYAASLGYTRDVCHYGPPRPDDPKPTREGE